MTCGRFLAIGRCSLFGERLTQRVEIEAQRFASLRRAIVPFDLDFRTPYAATPTAEMLTKRMAARWLCILLGLAMSGALSRAEAQRLGEPRFQEADAPVVQVSVLELPVPQVSDDGFNWIGFVIGAALGGALGGFLGYHIDRYFELSKGDDPGIGGFLIGVLAGGTTGAILGGEVD